MNIVRLTYEDTRVAELFGYLDETIELVGRMLDKLNQLRAAVIQRNEPALRQIQDEIPECIALRVVADEKQKRIRRSFAAEINKSEQEINLSEIGKLLESDAEKQLKDRQSTLKELVARLSAEHRATELLLRECDRMNRMFFEAIVGRKNHTITYTPQGQALREVQRSMVSARL